MAQQVIVLVKDDHASTLYKHVLEEDGRYQVLVAESGQEGFSLIHEQHPALVIAEALLPGMSGFALAKLIKEDKNLAQLPILVIVGKEASEAKSRLLDLYCDAYLEKPITLEQLQTSVEKLLHP